MNKKKKKTSLKYRKKKCYLHLKDEKELAEHLPSIPVGTGMKRLNKLPQGPGRDSQDLKSGNPTPKSSSFSHFCAGPVVSCEARGIGMDYQPSLLIEVGSH
jgi:hypothetical protein